MTISRSCKRCGKPIPSMGTEGLCPHCLLKAGLEAAILPEAPSKANGPDVKDRTEDFEILERIGQGGMGVVYRARQISLNRFVALKVLPLGPHPSQESILRFQAEASAAAALQHPNIVAIHEVGVIDGQPFFSMDLVEGSTLGELVRERPMPAKRSAGYLKTIAVAAHYAHQRGIIHRDLKPSNILIDQSDQPRITDFGLAKRLTEASDLTLPGQVLGSPHFMAPEQVEGKHVTLGPASDVYALGAVLYQLLTRQPPFQADTLTTLLKQVAESDPISPRLINPNIPKDLETICLKCLEKEPGRRYPSAGDLAEELGRFLEDEPIRARPVGRGTLVWRRCRRRPWTTGLAAALVFSSCLGLAGIFWGWRIANQNARIAQADRYAADMHLAQLALLQTKANRRLTIDLLDAYRPARFPTKASGRDALPERRGWEWRYLWARSRPDKPLFWHQFPSAILGIHFSDDKERLRIATRRQIACWNLPEWRPLWAIPVADTREVGFSRAGSWIARAVFEANRGHLVEIWDWRKKAVMKKIPFQDRIRSLAISPDGKWLAAFEENGTIHLLDWRTGNHSSSLRVRPPRHSDAGCLAFSPDGARLAVGTGHAGVVLVDLPSQTGANLKGNEITVVHCLAFSPDSRRLAVGLGLTRGQIQLWSLTDQAPPKVIPNLLGDIGAMAFSTDGTKLAAADRDTIRIWTVEPLDPGHPSRVIDTCPRVVRGLAWLPDSQSVISGDSEGLISLWDARPQDTIRLSYYTSWKITKGFDVYADLDPSDFSLNALHPDAICRFGIGFTPDARGLSVNLLKLDSDHYLELLDTKTFTLKGRLKTFGPDLWGFALSSDRHYLATGSGTNITVWNWKSKERIEELQVPFEWLGLIYFNEDVEYLRALIVHNNGRITNKIWRTRDWNEIQLTMEQETERVYTSYFTVSPDGQYFLFGKSNGRVNVYRRPENELIKRFTIGESAVTGIAFSPDRRYLAACGEVAKIWEFSTEEEKAEFEGHRAGMWALAWSPDQRRLATSGHGDGVKLWDVMTHQEVLHFACNGLYLCDLAFSPDGQCLVAISMDGKGYLWRAPSWEEIQAYESESLPITR